MRIDGNYGDWTSLRAAAAMQATASSTGTVAAGRANGRARTGQHRRLRAPLQAAASLLGEPITVVSTDPGRPQEAVQPPDLDPELFPPLDRPQDAAHTAAACWGFLSASEPFMHPLP